MAQASGAVDGVLSQLKAKISASNATKDATLPPSPLSLLTSDWEKVQGGVKRKRHKHKQRQKRGRSEWQIAHQTQPQITADMNARMVELKNQNREHQMFQIHFVQYVLIEVGKLQRYVNFFSDRYLADLNYPKKRRAYIEQRLAKNESIRELEWDLSRESQAIFALLETIGGADKPRTDNPSVHHEIQHPEMPQIPQMTQMLRRFE